MKLIFKWSEYEPGFWAGHIAEDRMAAHVTLVREGRHAGKYHAQRRRLVAFGVEPSWLHVGYYASLGEAKRRVSAVIRRESRPIGYRKGGKSKAPRSPRKLGQLTSAVRKLIG